MAEGGNAEQYREATLSREERVKEIKEITGYEFNDPVLLEHAFTHPSFRKKEAEDRYYQNRLEFLGDAVLGFLAAEYHYENYPDLLSGTLTRLRAVHVDNENLARVGLKHNLYKFLRHDIGNYGEQIKEFTECVQAIPEYSYGGVRTPKVVSDVVEALVGAIYLDSSRSMETTQMIARRLLEPMIHPENLRVNPVSLLNEIRQKYGLEVTEKDTWAATREMSYVMDEVIIGTAKYEKNKKIAQHIAAQEACNYVLKNLLTKINATHV